MFAAGYIHPHTPRRSRRAATHSAFELVAQAYKKVQEDFQEFVKAHVVDESEKDKKEEDKKE